MFFSIVQDLRVATPHFWPNFPFESELRGIFVELRLLSILKSLYGGLIYL